jgi:hypothetical protein
MIVGWTDLQQIVATTELSIANACKSKEAATNLFAGISTLGHYDRAFLVAQILSWSFLILPSRLRPIAYRLAKCALPKRWTANASSSPNQIGDGKPKAREGYAVRCRS